MVASRERLLLMGSRSALVSPGTRRGCRRRAGSAVGTPGSRRRVLGCRHWPATSAPRTSRFLPPAPFSAVATASPMSPLRIGDSRCRRLRRPMREEEARGRRTGSPHCPAPRPPSVLPTSQVRRPTSIAPVAAAISAKSPGGTKSASGRPPPQSIAWPAAGDEAVERHRPVHDRLAVSGAGFRRTSSRGHPDRP